MTHDIENMTEFDVLKGKGLVRELHVYGETTAVNSYKYDAAQHRGIGGGLLKLAEKITKQHNLYGIAVISGDGVRGYYEEKHGYYDVETFMVKYFNFLEVWFEILVYYFKLPYRAFQTNSYKFLCFNCKLHG